MSIPIFNTLYEKKINNFKFKNLDIKKLNHLNLREIDQKKFPLTKILKSIPEKNSLFETIIVSANDELVNLFLNKKISFINFQKILLNFVKLKEFTKLKKKSLKI